MALQEYVGAIVLEVDGTEVNIESLSETHNIGRKAVKTMNRTGRIAGYARGVETIDLKLTVPVPLSGELDWAAVVGAKITRYPVDSPAVKVSYLDCFTTEVGAQYQVDGEAKRDVSMTAVRKVNG